MARDPLMWLCAELRVIGKRVTDMEKANRPRVVRLDELLPVPPYESKLAEPFPHKPPGLFLHAEVIDEFPDSEFADVYNAELPDVDEQYEFQKVAPNVTFLDNARCKRLSVEVIDEFTDSEFADVYNAEPPDFEHHDKFSDSELADCTALVPEDPLPIPNFSKAVRFDIDDDNEQDVTINDTAIDADTSDYSPLSPRHVNLLIEIARKMCVSTGVKIGEQMGELMGEKFIAVNDELTKLVKDMNEIQSRADLMTHSVVSQLSRLHGIDLDLHWDYKINHKEIENHAEAVCFEYADLCECLRTITSPKRYSFKTRGF